MTFDPNMHPQPLHEFTQRLKEQHARVALMDAAEALLKVAEGRSVPGGMAEPLRALQSAMRVLRPATAGDKA